MFRSRTDAHRAGSHWLAPVLALLVFALPAILFTGCQPSGDTGDAGDTSAADAQTAMNVDTPDELPNGLLVAVAALGKTDDGKPKPLPARLGILTRQGGAWTYEILEDADSNVFHKGMVFDPAGDVPAGILTLGGMGAHVKLWHHGADGWSAETLWHEDFGGRFSRMRDGEIGDLDGDGSADLAIATHDQGVVATLSAGEGGWQATELDREADIFVHEIEVGDLDGDGNLEVYATPSARNQLDGTPQPGEVTRYVPATGGAREIVADLGDRHAKEILVTDMDGDGSDELYVSVEAVSGGQVEIRRFVADTLGGPGEMIASLPDQLCRFLTAGDIDGDGKPEMVAASKKAGLWLLRPTAEGWSQTKIDADSGGFEHAAILTDLDGDGTDELYVASDDHDEIRRYVWVDGEPVRDTLHVHEDGLARFTWNLMPVPLELVTAQ